MKFLKLFLCVLIVGESLSVSAEEIWIGRTKIIAIYPTESEFLFKVDASNAISTCDGGRRFGISMSAPNYNVMVSALMAAFMARKEIEFNVNDNQGASCEPLINRFRVY